MPKRVASFMQIGVRRYVVSRAIARIRGYFRRPVNVMGLLLLWCVVYVGDVGGVNWLVDLE